MVPVLEAVPNFSSGRDPELLERLSDAVADVGADVLDASADASHNRAVLTFIGSPGVVEEAAMAVARVAVETIDLQSHHGAHPRIGSLDVMPFVPLAGLTMADARASARRVGHRIARELGIPVYFYGAASEPPGRGLAELRRGGYETLVQSFPEGRRPDLLPDGWTHPGVHPTAGATCVGARPVLLAWNVVVEGLEPEALRRLATELRERDGGFPGLRALGLVLDDGARLQVSMNLEDVGNCKPFQVFRAVEQRVASAGGKVLGTEVIGMIPDALLFEAGADRLSLLDPEPHRVLSSRLLEHLADRVAREVDACVQFVRAAGAGVPPEVREAVQRLEEALTEPARRNGSA